MTNYESCLAKEVLNVLRCLAVVSSENKIAQKRTDKKDGDLLKTRKTKQPEGRTNKQETMKKKNPTEIAKGRVTKRIPGIKESE